MRTRFRWTRNLYRQADSLARFCGRHLYELPCEQPGLLRRYFELWQQHPQNDDELLLPFSIRRSVMSRNDDDIPF